MSKSEFTAIENYQNVGMGNSENSDTNNKH